MTFVCFAGLQEGIGFRPAMVGGIGELLGFEADSGALLVGNAVLADDTAIEEVAGVDLHSRLDGEDFHCNARDGTLQSGARTGVVTLGVEHPVMVVAATNA